MNFITELIHDKVEAAEAVSLLELEKKINDLIEINKALMLEVHHISYQVASSPKGFLLYSAIVHFKAKKHA
ncbi:DUF2536 family protein [Fictibacillus aquaticus]|uniref:DUF2536 domain-containing protein n=1 Tax=Fictibacillus aquaticus TaxID=2021314 RepID=A0A235FAG9_9BACL|nr:DUF2536 family protein [Fictibacillus aquaticus]OYD58014.1 hypothetical protein CGZ90_08985 [Fictibacillus aquaticus]